MIDDEGTEPAVNEIAAGQVLQRAAEVRDQVGRQRDLAAQRRDQAGRQRDLVADLRDRVAEQRDEPGKDARGTATGIDPATPEEPDPLTTQGSASSDRDHARQDRGAGAGDRVEAEHDRSRASADRAAAARDRWQASVDGLTGVYTREAGLVELDRDLARVQRTGHHLALAFVDVDRLKETNDNHGHAAGDRLLVAVAITLQAALRPYDLIIRYGGDEFLCAAEGIDAATAGPRFARINTLLAQTLEGGSVTLGLAQFQAGESSASLIARADADLYEQRQHRSH